MARALRIERPGGRYRVTARGNECQDLFRSDADRFQFLEPLSELGERFGVRVHAYVLSSTAASKSQHRTWANKSPAAAPSVLNDLGHPPLPSVVAASFLAPVPGRYA
jgi:hypothetical protein